MCRITFVVASLVCVIAAGCGGGRAGADGGRAGIGGNGGGAGGRGGSGGAAANGGGAGGGTSDGGTADAFSPHDALPAPSSHALVPGGTKSASSSYVIVRTVGQSPGGNRVRASASYKMVGGLVGSTQK